jgi:hypothetical protein
VPVYIGCNFGTLISLEYLTTYFSIHTHSLLCTTIVVYIRLQLSDDVRAFTVDPTFCNAIVGCHMYIVLPRISYISFAIAALIG